MVRRTGWGGSRRQRGRWGDLGPGSVPLLPTPLPPLPPPLCRGPGGGRVSIFSLSPAPHTRSSTSSAPPLALGPPCPVVQAPGTSQSRHSALPTPATPPTQARPAMIPISAPQSWGSHSTPPLASVTPPPTCRCPQDPPGLRIGPLIPEQDYERLEDCDPEGSQHSPLHGEEQQPLLHVPEGLRGEAVRVGLWREWVGEDLGAPGLPPGWVSGSWLRAWRAITQVRAIPSALPSVSRLLAPHPEPGQLLHQDILCAWPGSGGMGGPLGAGMVLGRETEGAVGWRPCWGSDGSVLWKVPLASGLFLDTLPHLQLPPEEWLCLHPAGGCLPAGVRCLSRTPNSSSCFPSSACCSTQCLHKQPRGLAGVGRITGLVWRVGQDLAWPSRLITAPPAPPRQFVFIVTFTTFLLRCVDYNILFANQPNNRTRPGLLHSKVTLSDAILPSAQCAQR